MMQGRDGAKKAEKREGSREKKRNVGIVSQIISVSSFL